MAQTLCKSLTAGLLVLMLILTLAGGIPKTDTAADAVIGEPGIAAAHSGHHCGPRYSIHMTGPYSYERIDSYGSSWFRNWARVSKWEYLHWARTYVKVDSFNRYGCRLVSR